MRYSGPGRLSLAAGLVLALGLLAGAGGCGGSKESPAHTSGLPAVRFTDVTAQAGITFRHTNGAFGKKLLPETMGSGVVFLDFDGDGRQDILFVNSCGWPGYEGKGPAPTLALYRNRGDGTFEDVTKAAGLDVTLYGMGVAVGDFDNDGWEDLFLTALGGNRLYRNVPDGKGGRRFEDVTGQSGDVARGSGWETSGDFLDREAAVDFPSSAAFLDYDNDGYLDLFVCYYVTWSPRHDLAQGFTLAGHDRAYGPPKFFRGSQCRLFHNVADGKGGRRFVDVSERAGIQVRDDKGEPAGKSLGVAVCDVDGDGWPDLVVANDTVRNFLFHNQRDGTFRECGREAGVAYAQGDARGAMGVDWGEIRPGFRALAIANFTNEPTSLLRLEDPQRLLFSDVAQLEGLAGPSRSTLRFGLFFFDYDLDGRLDLLTCNGHLEPKINTVQADQSYRQPAQLFWNTGKSPAFEPADPGPCGPDLFRPLVGRGAAFADVDGNGTLDVVLTENGGPARLLRNEGGTGNHWVRLVLRGDGRRCNTSALGAEVTLVTPDGQVQHRAVTGARGYLSQSELPLTFGLGKARRVERVEVRWPGRALRPQVLTGLGVNKTHRIVQD